MSRISQTQTVQEVHPFDMEKSEFEKLLERDFKPMETAVQDVVDAQHETNFTRAVKMARAIDRLKNLLDENVMSLLLPLMNTKLGFRCDRPSRRNNTPYTVAEIRSCMIEALIRGAFLTGNEFNIISGNCYFTKEYFWRKILEHPDVTEFTPVPGLPKVLERGCVIPYKCTWRMRGESTARTMERDIPIKTDEYSSTDQSIGKADRKMWASVWNSISGWREPVPDGDVTELPAEVATNGDAAKRISLRGQNRPSPNGGAAAPSNASPSNIQEAGTTPGAGTGQQPRETGPASQNTGAVAPTGDGDVPNNNTAPINPSNPPTSPGAAPTAAPAAGGRPSKFKKCSCGLVLTAAGECPNCGPQNTSTAAVPTTPAKGTEAATTTPSAASPQSEDFPDDTPPEPTQEDPKVRRARLREQAVAEVAKMNAEEIDALIGMTAESDDPRTRKIWVDTKAAMKSQWNGNVVDLLGSMKKKVCQYIVLYGLLTPAQ